MMSFLSLIFRFFDPIARITDKIIDWQAKKIDAKTEQERIAADERVRTLEARRDVMVAEAGAGIRLNAYIRTAIGFGVALFLNKIFVWDKVLKFGTTDPLDANLWNVVMVVLGFYFLDSMVSRWKR